MSDLSSPVPAPADIGKMLDRVIDKAPLAYVAKAIHHPVHAELADAKSEILLLVSRLRSQVERLKAAIGLIVQLANTDHEQFCGAWNNYPEDCNCSYKAANDALRRLSSDSE